MFHIPNPKSLPKDPSDPQKRYDKTNHSGLYLTPKNPVAPKNPSTHPPTSQTTQSQQTTTPPTPRNHSAVRQTPKLNQYGLIPIVPLPTPDQMLSYTGDQTFFHDPFAAPAEDTPKGSLADLTATLTQAKQTLKNLEDAYQALYQKTLTKNVHTHVDPITAQHAGRQKVQTTTKDFQIKAKQKDAVQATAQDPAVQQAQKNILTQQNTVQHTATQIDARGEILSAQNLRSTANQATRAYYEEQKKATLPPATLTTLAEKAGTARRTAELAEQKAKEAADAAGIPFETAYDLTPAEARVLYGDGIDTRTPPTKNPTDQHTDPDKANTTSAAPAPDTPTPKNSDTKTPDTPPTSSPNQQATLTTKTPSFTPTYATSRSGVVTGTAVASVSTLTSTLPPEAVKKLQEEIAAIERDIRALPENAKASAEEIAAQVSQKIEETMRKAVESTKGVRDDAAVAVMQGLFLLKLAYNPELQSLAQRYVAGGSRNAVHYLSTTSDYYKTLTALTPKDLATAAPTNASRSHVDNATDEQGNKLIQYLDQEYRDTIKAARETAVKAGIVPQSIYDTGGEVPAISYQDYTQKLIDYSQKTGIKAFSYATFIDRDTGNLASNLGPYGTYVYGKIYIVDSKAIFVGKANIYDYWDYDMKPSGGFWRFVRNSATEGASAALEAEAKKRGTKTAPFHVRFKESVDIIWRH